MPDKSAPPPDPRRAVGKARNAAILSAIMLVATAAFIYVVGARAWSAQGGYDAKYSNGGYLVFAALTVFIPLYFLIIALLARPRFRELGIAAAFSTGWTIGALLLAVMIAGCIPMRGEPPRLLVLLVYAPMFPIAALVLFLAQMRLARQSMAAFPLIGKRATAIVGMAWPVAYIAVATAVVLPSERRFLMYQTDHAVRAVWRVHGCAYRYAARNPTIGFPTKRALFDEERECLGPFASYRGYRFNLSYAAGAKDATGRVSNFLTRTRQKHLWFQRYESLAADAAGIVHIAYRRNATLDDHIAPMAGVSVRGFTGCLGLYKHRHDQRGYPLDWSGIQEMGCATVEPRIAPNVTEQSGYRASYFPLDADRTTGYAGGYIVRVRPTVFGETGVRSYYQDHRTPGIHATGADREATADDPLVQSCEFESGHYPWKPCPQDPR